MTFRLLALALACTAAIACTPRADAPATPSRTDAPADAAPATRARLAAYTWSLESAVDAQGKRLDVLFPANAEGRLSFDAEHPRVGASFGCNGMGGDYQLDADGTLRHPPDPAYGWASSARGCPGINEAETALTQLFMVPLRARITAGDAPVLHLDTLDTGTRTRWRGTPTPQTRYGQAGTPVLLEIDPRPVRCPAPALHSSEGGCLRVREVPDDYNLILATPATPGPGAWSVLEGIDGYSHDPRLRQLVRVRRFETTDGPRHVFAGSAMSMADDAPL